MNPHQPNQGEGGDGTTAGRGRVSRDTMNPGFRSSNPNGIIATQQHSPALFQFRGLHEFPTTNAGTQFLPDLSSPPPYPTTIAVPSDVSRTSDRSRRLPDLNAARQHMFRPDYHMTHHGRRRGTSISSRKPLSMSVIITNNGLKMAPSSRSNPDQITTNTNRTNRAASQCPFFPRTITYQIGEHGASTANARYSNDNSYSHNHCYSIPGTFARQI